MIPNPAYVTRTTRLDLQKFSDLRYVGFELWQVKPAPSSTTCS